VKLNSVEDIYPLLPRQQGIYWDFQEWLQQQDWSKAEWFWRQVLKGFSIPTPLTVNRVVADHFPDQQQSRGQQEIRFTAAVTSALEALAQQHQLTLNTIIQGAWSLLLSRYCGAEEVLFGVLKVGRWPVGTETGVGQFVNLLPIRIGLPPDLPVLPWLKKLQAQQIARQPYEHTPLAKVREWSDVPVGLPLFESIVAFESNLMATAVQRQGGNGKKRSDRAWEQLNYPLTLSGYARSNLLLRVAYDRPRFDEATVSRLLGHLKTLLEGIVAHPDQSISMLPILTKTERHQLLVEWNDTTANYPKDQGVHELFEAQVARTPAAVALICQGEQLTYQELNCRANQLARYLRAHGVGPEVLVGICIERSLAMVVGILGILKAGGAYVPLDPDHPLPRVQEILQDTKPPVLLVRKTSDRFGEYEGQKIYLDDDWRLIEKEADSNLLSLSAPENLLKIVYTSSSTGKPKGTLITIDSVLNRLFWMWESYPFRADDVVVFHKSYALVAASWECFGGLLQGIPTVIVLRQDLLDPAELWQKLVEQRVSYLLATPALLQGLIEQAELHPDQWRTLRLATTSAEPISPALAARWNKRFPQVPLFNLYGSTECSSNVTAYDTSKLPPAEPGVPIGKPLANTKVYILDEHLNPVPIGVTGEMCVSGACVARGYLNLPELSARQFVQNPFTDQPNSRLYRTGDLARYRADGNIELIGRKDHQVKVRGFRVELGDIEFTLARHEAVRRCVVTMHEEDARGKYLVAYVVTETDISTTLLRRYLRERLPDYMAPATFVLLESLPLTPNGKVDRNGLSPPTGPRPGLDTPYTAPRTEVEQIISTVLQEVLDVEKVGIHDYFLDLGLHSLLMVQVQSELRRVLNTDIPIIALLRYSTASSLADYLNRNRDEPLYFQQSLARASKRKAMRQRRRKRIAYNRSK
jgi:amino acid adenylation domain-containing protein